MLQQNHINKQRLLQISSTAWWAPAPVVLGHGIRTDRKFEDGLNNKPADANTYFIKWLYCIEEPQTAANC